MGGEKLKWCQPGHNQLISPQGPHFSPNIKPTIKAQISGRMISSGTSVVAFASVYSEKTRLKKLIMIIIIIIIIIMNKLQEMIVFGGHQKLTLPL